MLADDSDGDYVWEDFEGSDLAAKRRPLRALNFAPQQLGRGMSENLSVSSSQEGGCCALHDSTVAALEAEFDDADADSIV